MATAMPNLATVNGYEVGDPVVPWMATPDRSRKVNPGRLTLTPKWNQQAEISSPPVNSSGMQKGYSQGEIGWMIYLPYCTVHL